MAISRRPIRAVAAFAALVIPQVVLAQQVPNIGELRVPDQIVTDSGTGGRIAPRLLRTKGQVNVWVQLQDAPLAVAQADARATGLPLTKSEQRAYLAGLRDKHDELALNARSLGGSELGRVSKAHNAIALSIDASKLSALAAMPNVLTVRPVIDYQVSATAETVPYIGATAVQGLGFTGRGIRVAVLDSGIDYTHKDLFGSGTAADYTAAFGTSLDDVRNKTINPALFPTAKVVGGFDFVGEHWPNAALAPDPNPIACGGVGGCDGTHGTHVSDIIAGKSTDGTHVGVAPDAQLYAVKVCSSVSTACSGVALIQGMDFALDPDGDGDLSDAVDVINMSLGSNYGQFEDDLTLASENASRLGVVVACAAGNAADHPYIVSSPSIAPGAISVAQTQVPSAQFFPVIINSPSGIAPFTNTATVDWAPITNNPFTGTSGFTGNVAFVGRGCPAGSITATNPDDPYLASPAGKVALIDRGACAVSLKVDRAFAAGAIGVLIGLVAPGDAVSFSYGGGTHLGPTLVIIQRDANTLKTALASGAVNVTVHDSSPLIMSMASTSARGPSYSYQTIKPEIGAPGASISAVAGTGTFEAAFGGTSGATPMIAGSAALLLQAFPGASPAEIKARLMNNTELRIKTAPNISGNQIAPATRIGGGEVRVDRALRATTFAWVVVDETAGVSFGAPSLSERREFHKTVTVVNTSKSKRTYSVTANFRDTVNAATGAARFDLPRSVEVGPRGSKSFDVTLRIDPSQLFTWTLNGGSQGGNGPLQTALELDGHITISDRSESITLPWSILPHKAADVHADDDVELRGGSGTLRLENEGVLAGRTDVFAWTGTSPKIAKRFLPNPGDNFAIIDLGHVGVRQALAGSTPVVQFAISTFGKRAHPNYPAEFDVLIDTNNDGTPDFDVFNLENGGFGASGQNVVAVTNLAKHTTTVVAFADADLNSSNMIYTVPLAAVGLTPTSQFTFSVLAFDNYFTGNLTDSIQNMTFSFKTPRFTSSQPPATGVPSDGRVTLTVSEVSGGATASPSQTGLLLMYRDAAKREAQPVTVTSGGESGAGH